MPESPNAGPTPDVIARSAPLYAPVEPYEHGWMDTGDGHRIYFEQCGNPQGLPVLVLHGGPASGCSPLQRRFFDPATCRVILFDQRGCGRSTPRAGLANNDTAALLRDIEQLRRQLDVAAWIVFGGSWGASLAIAYSSEHPSSCRGLVLRGTFLTGSRDLDWFFGGAGTLLPAAWQRLVHELGLPLTLDQCEHAGHAVLAVLKRRLSSDEQGVAAATATAWADWEEAVSRPGTGKLLVASGESGDRSNRPPASNPGLVDKYRVQAHYLEQQCFLGEERLLALAARLTAFPVELVHGRLDWVCRPGNAWQVHQAVPGSTLTWVDHAGHNPYDPPMLSALGEAMQRVRDYA